MRFRAYVFEDYGVGTAGSRPFSLWRSAMLFEAAPENVPRAREALRDQLAPLGLTTRQLADISIAVTEAVTNSVTHAYRHQPQAGAVRIETTVADDTITITVSDTGCGPLPNPDSDGLGMGIPLMTALANTLQIEGQAGQGTTVRMAFPTNLGTQPDAILRASAQPDSHFRERAQGA